MKKYVHTIVAALILCLFTQTAEARLGETKSQCEKRYGKAAKKDGDAWLFVAKKIVVKTFFKNGKCVSIAYAQVGDEGMFTLAQILKLAEANTGRGQAAQWAGDDNEDGSLLLGFKSGPYYMLVDGENDCLILTTIANANEALQEQKEAEEKAVEGL